MIVSRPGYLSSICSTTGLGLAALWAVGCSQPKAQPVEPGAKAHPIAVDSVLVDAREMPNTLLLAGTLKANQESDLAANASGRVTRTSVERGSYVASGSVVAQLDTRMATLGASEAEANVETLRAQKAHADEECVRNERLYQQGAIARQEYERQATNCKTAGSSTAAAESRAELMKQTLADGTIRAPFPGLVSERYVSVGEYVTPSSRVAHVVDIDPLRLELTIPEQNMGAVRKGQVVEFQVGAFPNQTFRGKVQYIGPAVRATTRDLVFEAIVPNKDKLLRPGLFATSRLDVGTEKLPVVPRTAVRQDGDTARVYAIVDRHVEERIVQLGAVEGDHVAIVKGVAAGERVVDHPSERVSDGAEVQ
jgi:membrane fusion protein (multidrug efflux system)